MSAWPAAEDAALDGLRAVWSLAYRIDAAGGGYEARFLFVESPPMTAATLEGIDSAIRADWSRWGAR
jgi:hypothetical protein